MISTMLNILISPNSFKGSMTAERVADAMEVGLNQSGIKASIHKFPIADGGDHTAHLITKHLKGKIQSSQVSGAYLQSTTAISGVVNNGRTVVIEVAETSGFKSIKGNLQSPLNSSTKGLGELINQGIQSGVTDFVICLGGSATVDGGIGMLQELGVRFLDASGEVFTALPSNFERVCKIEMSEFSKTIAGTSYTILCDVDNRLLGEDGAARVFGPQKGADHSDVEKLEEFLGHFNSLVQQTFGKDMNSVVGGAAAGGLGAAFDVFMKAKMVKGASFFCELTGFDAYLKKADLLITGEGSIDSQSLEGKAPVVVARMAKALNIPVIGLAGMVPVDITDELQSLFAMLIAIGNKPESLQDAISRGESNLIRSAKQIGLMVQALDKK